MPHALVRAFLSTSLLAGALAAGTAQAAEGGPPPVGPMTSHQLTPEVYWVEGGVGNTGFIIGRQGVTVVDATISEVGGKALLAEIAKVTPKPVTTVILTHGDGDHVNGLGAFPAGVTVIAHPGNKARMEAAVAAGRSPIPKDKLPNHTVARNELLDKDGVKIELHHWAPAHTDGDLVVYLPQQKIVFTGDIFAMNQPRALIHREQNGTSEGWVTTAKGLLSLDADRFVPGHGEVQGKTVLQERVKVVEDERAKIKALVAQGKPLPEIQAAVGDPPPGPPAAGSPRFPPFSTVVYQELTAGAPGGAGAR